MSSQKTISILGCGWLGLPLGKTLVQSGHIVHGSTTSPSKRASLKREQITPHLIQDVSQGNAIFFASDILIITLPFKRSFADPFDYVAQIDHIKNLATAGGVSWILFTSSTSIYSANNQIASEDLAIQTESARQDALLAAENTLLNADTFDTTIVRLAGLYGPDRPLGRFLRNATQPIPGGQNPVNLIHLDDCIGIMTAIITHNYRNEILNGCSDHHPQKQTLYQQKASEMGLPRPNFQDNTTAHKIIANDKVKKHLSYRFLHPDPMITT